MADRVAAPAARWRARRVGLAFLTAGRLRRLRFDRLRLMVQHVVGKIPFLTVVVIRNTSAGEKMLEFQPIHLCHAAGLGEREPFLLEKHDRDFPSTLNLRHLGGFENLGRDD